MKKKVVEIFQFFVGVILLPLLPKPHRLMTWQVFAVTFAGVFIYLSQPSFEKTEMLNRESPDRRSALLILVSFVLMFLVPIVDFGYFNRSCCAAPVWLKYLGVGMAMGGLTFRYWAIRTLGRFFTSTVKIQSDHQLIETGPYKYLRHPSYTGAWLMGLGISLILESYVGLIVALILSTFAYFYRMRVEEGALVQKLGSVYQAYQKRTWRLIPFIY